MTLEKSKQGKKNRKAGSAFELKVRKDLESKGWIVSKWQNNVSDYPESNIYLPPEKREDRKLIPAKHKFCGIGRPMAIGTGFPDFIAFRLSCISNHSTLREDSKNPMKDYEIIGVEAKSNGYLDKEEREKFKWLLENNIFSKILIASKSDKHGEINYKEFNITNDY